jgi:prophage DNA circulation protein
MALVLAGPGITFDDWVIPATRLSISSNGRISIHEYRWIRGGKIEDHGRGLYSFRVNATFTTDPRYRPALYPDTVSQLRALYESRKVGTLALPDIGRVLCRISEWDQDQQFPGGRPTSAEVSLSFLEDDGNRFLPVTTTQATQAGFADATAKWTKFVSDNHPDPAFAPVDLKGLQKKKAFDVFDQISAVANAILGIRDQLNLASELLASKIDSLTNLLEEADRGAWLNDPMNFEFVYALKALWSATLQLANDKPAGTEIRTYRVTRTSSVSQVSYAIYGDTTRARDLLGLNDFPDAMAIPAGTSVTYLQEAA